MINYPCIFSSGFYQTVLWWILIAALLVLSIGWAIEAGSRPFKTKSSLEILKHRYAKGQIGKQEYEERRRVLIG